MPVPLTRNGLTRISQFAPALIAILALGAFLSIYEFTRLQRISTAGIILSSQQRSATQSVASLSLKLVQSKDAVERETIRQQLDAAIRFVETAHEQLIRQTAETGWLNRPSPDLQFIYFSPPIQLDQQERGFIARGRKLLDSTESDLSADNPDLNFILTAANGSLQSGLGAAIQQYEIEDNLASTRMQQIGLGAVALILATLFVQSLFIFRPMQRHSERDVRKLADSQNLLDAVLDTVGEAIVTVDRSNVIVRINQEVQNIWEYSQPELVGEKFQKLLAPRFRETHHDASDVGNLGKRFEIEGLKKDGTIFPLEIRITKTMTDGAVLFTSAMRDVTEAKRAEGLIRHQLDTIKALYNGAQKLTESLDLHFLAEDITRTCVNEFGVRLAWLGRAETDGVVRPFAHYPPNNDYLQQIAVRWDNPEDPAAQGPSGRAIRNRTPVVADVANDPSFRPWRDVALAHGFRSAASFPLISGDRPFGTLQLHSDHSDFFTAERVDFFQSYAHQAAAALENARLFADDRRQLERLQALRAVDTAITSSLDLRVILSVLLDQVVTHLGVDATAVLLLNPQSQVLEHAADRGFRYANIRRSHLRLGKGLAGRAAFGRKTISAPNLAEAAEDATRATLLVGEGFVAYYAIPLMAKGQVKGVLEIFQRAPFATDPEWQNFLEALAVQAAIAIDNASLLEGLQQSNRELALAYDDTLEGWSTALDLRDRETEGHTARVTMMAMHLARIMELSSDELLQIHRGSLLHDIGKMGIPDSILLKNGPLTAEEWAIMRQHPIYAYEMLAPIAYLRPALDIPYGHHERWDGTGYPRGLKGKQIPLAARIFAVPDVYDALTTDRPYHKALSADQACDHIASLAGQQFDPEVVRIFLKMLSDSSQPAT